MKKICMLQLKKGMKLGKLTIEKMVKHIVREHQLVAKEDVEEASWWKLFKRSFGMFTKIE